MLERGLVVLVAIVTVGVCVRNGSRTITDAIRSIAKQDFPHEFMEIIFVDDGSEDDTLSVIQKSTAKIDIPVRIFHTGWQGLGPARNIVVKNAAGKYIVWVDSDMIIPENHIRMQVEFMEENSDVGIASGSYGLLEQGSLVAFLDNLAYVAYRFKSGGHTNLPGTGGSVCRVEAMRQVGGFDDNIRGSGEDVDAAYRVRSARWLVVRDKAAIFYGRSKETWRGLWKQYYWHGYGAHYSAHKNRGIVSLPMMSPPLAFLGGIPYGILAYKVVRRKIALLLPFHSVFKSFAWWAGYLKSHSKGYGHKFYIQA